MLIAVIGENCSGKSTLATKIQREFGAQIVSGKDYLRLAKSESEARTLFCKQLQNALAGENLIYVITEPELVEMLPAGAFRILVYADLETIKTRFRARMHGQLPPPVAQMLERKHGMFDNGDYACRYDGAGGDANLVFDAIRDCM